MARGASGKPPWVWARIVKACAGPAEDVAPLTPTHKLVYCEIVGMCVNRAYATIGAGAVGRRLGLSTRTVERARKDLADFGLLVRKDRGEGRTAAWFPTMPKVCQPGCRRLDEDQLETFANRLAHHIMRKPARTPTAGDGGVETPPRLRALP